MVSIEVPHIPNAKPMTVINWYWRAQQNSLTCSAAVTNFHKSHDDTKRQIQNDIIVTALTAARATSMENTQYAKKRCARHLNSIAR